MNEMLFLGGRPVIRPELMGFALGDVGDLLAYRAEWEPFISAHLALWRRLNEDFEASVVSKECPSGIFDASKLQGLTPSLQSFCSALNYTRIYTSDTDPRGILPQWNAWKDRSSADILAGASSMLEWHQSVVMRVGGTYKDNLLNVAKVWNTEVQLPDLPSFSTQQEIRARIEGAYISTKGVIQIVGYGIAQELKMVGDVTQAVAQGLKDTANQLPKTARWVAITAAVTAVVVGGVLIVYYVPRKQKPQAA